MNARDMNEALLASFPEIEDELKKYMDRQDGLSTGAFLTYEDVFRKRIEFAVREKEDIFLKKVADFIEEMLETEDEYACNVLIVGVLEGLKANCNKDDIKAFLQTKSLEKFDSI